MKFSQYLKALDLDAPSEWQGKFLKYKKLKKTLKSFGSCADLSKHADNTCCQAKRDAFFDELHKEVWKVNREFQTAARTVIRQAARTNSSSARCLFWCFASPAAKGDTGKYEELISKVEWTRRFAQINSIAYRKIVKKHDKLTKSRAGSDYLQEVWSGGLRSCGSFLHSPVLEELKSLQAMLEAQQAPNQAAAAAALERRSTISVELASGASGALEREELPMLPSLRSNATVSQHDDRDLDDAVALQRASAAEGSRRRNALPGATEEVNRAVDANEAAIQQSLQLRNISICSSGMGDEDELEVDNEYLCPICLEAMYQPIGLECGHRFCADCAFTSAGKGNAVGTVHAILDHVNPEAACPECRTKGVFVNAMELKETEKLIRQRYPKQWAERAADAKTKEQRLRELLAVQRQRVHQTFRAPF